MVLFFNPHKHTPEAERLCLVPRPYSLGTRGGGGLGGDFTFNNKSTYTTSPAVVHPYKIKTASLNNTTFTSLLWGRYSRYCYLRGHHMNTLPMSTLNFKGTSCHVTPPASIYSVTSHKRHCLYYRHFRSRSILIL